MSKLEIGQILILTLITLGYWWLLEWRANRPRRLDPNKQALIAEASASSVLVGALDSFIQHNTRLIIPSGDGLYIKRLISERPRLSNHWRKTLLKWDKRGAHIELLITIKNDEAMKFWLAETAGLQNVNIQFIDKAKLTAPLDALATSLDEFHPTLLLDELNRTDYEPKAMWIEWLHPTKSIIASHIEYVPPSAMNESMRARFDDYYKALTSLMTDGPHLETINNGMNLKERERAGSKVAQAPAELRAA